MKKRLPVILFSLLAIISVYNFTFSRAAVAVTYEVGPGKPYANIGDVPWESLQPGDTVLIYYRSTPYKEKWVICRQGTAAAPITVRGVLGPNGELPVIDGNGATTRLALDYWSEARGVIKSGGKHALAARHRWRARYEPQLAQTRLGRLVREFPGDG